MSVTYSGWAHQALSDDEDRAIRARVVDLHARLAVSLVRPEQKWRIQVSSWALDAEAQPVTYLERRWYAGLHLADCIARALDDYALAERYTADEIVQIANQSGLVA